MSKKKKSKIGYAEFSMHNFAQELVFGQNLIPEEDNKNEIEKQKDDE